METAESTEEKYKHTMSAILVVGYSGSGSGWRWICLHSEDTSPVRLREGQQAGHDLRQKQRFLHLPGDERTF